MSTENKDQMPACSEPQTFYHVRGVTQHYGTAKFHIFADCKPMNKVRRSTYSKFGHKPGTRPEIIEGQYDPAEFQICKTCRKRAAKNAFDVATKPAPDGSL